MIYSGLGPIANLPSKRKYKSVLRKVAYFYLISSAKDMGNHKILWGQKSRVDERGYSVIAAL